VVRLVGIFVLILFSPLCALGASTDFEDLVYSAKYIVGDIITSNDLSFEVVPFPKDNSNVHILNNHLDDGSGLDLFMGSKIGVDFQLPSGVQEISFLYGEFCCSSGVEINGVLNVPLGGLDTLDGMTIGGVSLSVISAGVFFNDQGMLTATGDISSFIVGGTEFAIDNVIILIPEPTTLILAVFGLIGVGCRWRR